MTKMTMDCVGAPPELWSLCIVYTIGSVLNAWEALISLEKMNDLLETPGWRRF
jgi:hypothetical protein